MPNYMIASGSRREVGSLESLVMSLESDFNLIDMFSIGHFKFSSIAGVRTNDSRLMTND